MESNLQLIFSKQISYAFRVAVQGFAEVKTLKGLYYSVSIITIPNFNIKIIYVEKGYFQLFNSDLSEPFSRIKLRYVYIYMCVYVIDDIYTRYKHNS